MKNIIKIITYVAASLMIFSLGSCDALLEQDETDFGKGPIVVQFQRKAVTSNFLQDDSGAIYEYTIPVEYQGADGEPLDEAVTLTISVSSESSATEGVEFDLVETEFTIPVGEKSANATIQVNSANLDATDPKTAILEIIASSQTVSDNNTAAITLQAICPSELEGEYEYINGAVGPVTITNTGPGTYEVSKDNAFVSPYPLTISDVCDELTVTGGFLPDNFGIANSGHGTVDPETGTITIYYTVDGYFVDRPMILQKI